MPCNCHRQSRRAYHYNEQYAYLGQSLSRLQTLTVEIRVRSLLSLRRNRGPTVTNGRMKTGTWMLVACIPSQHLFIFVLLEVWRIPSGVFVILRDKECLRAPVIGGWLLLPTSSIDRSLLALAAEGLGRDRTRRRWHFGRRSAGRLSRCC